MQTILNFVKSHILRQTRDYVGLPNLVKISQNTAEILRFENVQLLKNSKN